MSRRAAPHHRRAKNRVNFLKKEQADFSLARRFARRTLRVIGVLVFSWIAMLAAGFFALRWNLANVTGRVDAHSDEYAAVALAVEQPSGAASGGLPVVRTQQAVREEREQRRLSCDIAALAIVAPQHAKRLLTARGLGVDASTLEKMRFAVSLRLAETSSYHARHQECVSRQTDASAVTGAQDLLVESSGATISLFPWEQTEEWGIIRQAFVRDQALIERAAAQAGVPARLIVSIGMVEQLRLYNTQRELFEKFFKPLKILGNATKQALGIMAMKEKTALAIEAQLRNRASPFYLGSFAEHLLDLPSGHESSERYQRLTDEKNHSYSYLYAGLELAQFRQQWERAGFPIGDRPEIYATLFNIGFDRSKPNPSPRVGGSEVTIGGVHYTFGSLAYEFYFSGDLLDAFPVPAADVVTAGN